MKYEFVVYNIIIILESYKKKPPLWSEKKTYRKKRQTCSLISLRCALLGENQWTSRALARPSKNQPPKKFPSKITSSLSARPYFFLLPVWRAFSGPLEHMRNTRVMTRLLERREKKVSPFRGETRYMYVGAVFFCVQTPSLLPRHHLFGLKVKGARARVLGGLSESCAFVAALFLRRRLGGWIIFFCAYFGGTK